MNDAAPDGAVVGEGRRRLLVLGGLLPVGDREQGLGLVVAADDELRGEELLRLVDVDLLFGCVALRGAHFVDCCVALGNLKPARARR